MVMVLGGSGTANGITSFSSAATFNSTLSITGALTQSSGAAFNLASGQLAFPANQNPSSDANTLDDYEEGSWSMTDISGAGLTVSVSTAKYTKIGRLVRIDAYFNMPSTANTNTIQIAVPFPRNAYSTVHIGYSSGNRYGYAFLVEQGGYITLRNNLNGSGGSLSWASVSGEAFVISGTYEATA